MSKYTLEVRFICEQKAGLTSSVGCDKIDSVISKSWDKIFTSKVKFFSESYRKTLCSKILKHYYLQEIGFETVGQWMYHLNTRLEEIMPYYNQLYKSEQLKFDPLNNISVTRSHLMEFDGLVKTEDSGTRDSSTDSSYKDTNRMSDTPQGSLSGVESMRYLTQATITDGTSDQTTNENTESQGKTITDNEENFKETVEGKHGGDSYSDLLMKYRDTFLNIDLQVIDEFKDLFMGLW